MPQNGEPVVNWAEIDLPEDVDPYSDQVYTKAWENFAALQDKRVGLVVNPASVDSRLLSTVDVLNDAPNVNLVALFGPEHGVYGDEYAGDKVEDRTDPATGLPILSLYGATRKPTPEMLANIDVLEHEPPVPEDDGEHLDGREQRGVEGQPVVHRPVGGAEQVRARAHGVAELDERLQAASRVDGELPRADALVMSEPSGVRSW